VPELYKLAVSTASSLAQVASDEWKSRSYNFRCMAEADKRQKTLSQQRDFELVADYFLCEMPALSDKTRSVILSSFTSMADVLNRGVLRDLFTQGSNIDPTAIEQGKIIVVAMPLKEYGQIGLYAAALWKFAFQKSIERRDVTKNPRPVVLWQDEGQFFLLPGTDFLFTSTSRSARVANVLLTQSISGVIATLGGGPAGKAEADAYLSNYGTKIFHANTDPTSNEYAANLIGRCKQFVISANNNYGGNEGWSGFSVPALVKSSSTNCSPASSRNYARVALPTGARWMQSSSRTALALRPRAATG
jgi:type IV secretory pathway TraG/TraD family ATPase VirD4